MVKYIPNRGHLIWLDFDPQAGKEIQKRRPALVISPKEYNLKTHLCLVMPLTTKIKGYPFEVEVSNSRIKKGAILCDQVRSLDWKARNSKYMGKIDVSTLEDVMQKFQILID